MLIQEHLQLILSISISIIKMLQHEMKSNYLHAVTFSGMTYFFVLSLNVRQGAMMNE